MYGNKPWFQSTGVISSLAVILALLGNFFGVPFTDADQAELTDLLTRGVALIAGFGALYGRIAANKRIGG